MNPEQKVYVVQKGRKYLTSDAGLTPSLGRAKLFGSREEAARFQATHRRSGSVNLVQPEACQKCGLVFDPIMGHTCKAAFSPDRVPGKPL